MGLEIVKIPEEMSNMKILTDQADWFDAVKSLSDLQIHSFNLAKPKSEIYKHCLEHQIDVVICFNPQIIYEHSCVKELLPIPWLLPSGNGARMEDKFFAKQWLQDNNYASLMPHSKGLNQFPYVLKTGNGRGGNQVHYIQDKNDLDEHLPLPKKFITQKYIESPFEYAFHFIAKSGNIHIHETYQHDFESAFYDGQHYIRGISGRNTNTRRYQLSSQSLECLQGIIQDLNYSGFGCLDLKIVGSRLYLLEFNHRMGGSLLFYNHQMHDLKKFLSVYHEAIKSLDHLKLNK